MMTKQEAYRWEDVPRVQPSLSRGAAYVTARVLGYLGWSVVSPRKTGLLALRKTFHETGEGLRLGFQSVSDEVHSMRAESEERKFVRMRDTAARRFGINPEDLAASTATVQDDVEDVRTAFTSPAPGGA